MKLRNTLAILAAMVLIQAGSAKAESYVFDGKTVNVEYWSGSGSNEAMMVLDFGQGTSYGFGYRWDGDATSWNMLQAINQDGGLSMKVTMWYGYLPAVDELSYNGMTASSNWVASFLGYWGSTDGASWYAQPTGVADRTLSNGDWDGFSIEDCSQGDYDPHNVPVAPVSALVTDSTWSGNGAGVWTTAGNWSAGTPANGAATTVRFLGSITADTTVNLDAKVTVGQIIFDNANKYTLTAANDLTMTGAAIIDTVSGTHEIAAPLASAVGLNKTGAGTLILSNKADVTGEVTIADGTLAIAATGSLTASRVRGAALNVQGTVAIAPNGTEAGLSILNSLTIGAAGKFDLANNSLIVRGGDLAAIQGQIASAYANGTWGGYGITTTTGVAGMGLGVDTADNLGMTALAGQSVNPGDVLVKYTWMGDADFNGVVDFSDFLKLQAGYGKADRTWASGDFNYDGQVNFSDFLLLQAAYGKPALSGTVAPVSVPEPATLSLLVMGGLMLLKRKTRAKSAM